MLLTNRVLTHFILIIIIITFIIGLWPLSLFQQNEVQWLANKPGIEIHRSGIENKYASRGIVYSEDPFLFPQKPDSEIMSISLEVYLQSKKEPNSNLGMIIAFNEKHKPPSLLLAQWKKSLVLKTINTDLTSEKIYKEVGLSNALPKDSIQFISITSGNDGTKIYLNGEIKKHFPSFYIVSAKKPFSGKMILGNSASGNVPWAGNIFGIGIYEYELAPELINQHYQSWLLNDVSKLTSEDNIIALYTFEEGDGVIIENRISSKQHLIIPERFIILEKTMFELPWTNFKFNESFLSDFIINLVGFIPLGIMFSLYFNRILKINGIRLFLITLIIGGSISFLIELIQILIPQRNSSLSDLLLNIIGLCTGFLLVQFFFKFKKIEFVHNFLKI